MTQLETSSQKPRIVKGEMELSKVLIKLTMHKPKMQTQKIALKIVLVP